MVSERTQIQAKENRIWGKKILKIGIRERTSRSEELKGSQYKQSIANSKTNTQVVVFGIYLTPIISQYFDNRKMKLKENSSSK